MDPWTWSASGRQRRNRGRWLRPAALVLLVGCSVPVTIIGSDPDTEGEGGASSSTTAAAGDETSGATTTAEPGPEPDVETFALRIDAFEIPDVETTYACFEFSIPIPQLAHLIEFRPKVQNAEFVHHYVVSQLDARSDRPPGYPCFDLDGAAIWGWAPGQGDFAVPDDVGFLLGDQPGGEGHFRLQVHYNNPLQAQGQRDSSGVDLVVTTALRDNHAGTIIMGDISPIAIPPGVSAHEHVARCGGTTTSAVLPGPVQVFASTLHAHEIAIALWTDIESPDGQTVEVAKDDPFDFNGQGFRPVDVTILPGDSIVTHCVYDSSERSDWTFGGPSTTDEMCWNTLLYYPRLTSSFSYCGIL